MTEDDLKATELRAHVHEQESGDPHVAALAEDVRALVAEVRRQFLARCLEDMAIAGFSGCVSPSLAKQLKDAIAFAREQAARP